MSNPKISISTALTIIVSGILTIVPLIFPLVRYFLSFDTLLLVISVISTALICGIFFLVWTNEASAKFIKNLADVLWNVWSLIGIILVITSVDSNSAPTLSQLLSKLFDHPYLYGAIGMGLLLTAAARISSALNSLFKNK